jgi:hypothetical protein
MTSPPDGASTDATAKVGFDPLAVLERDSRILLNPNFLATLHAEMERELGAEQGRVTLFQMGFLHGLQDAMRALKKGGASSRSDVEHATVPPLQMTLRSQSPSESADHIELCGSWPERHEASAHLSALGPSHSAICFMSAGYTSGWLSGTLDANVLAIETTCCASGHGICHFLAREAENWCRDADHRVDLLLSALPFDAFRAAVREREERERALRAADFVDEAASKSGFDRDAAVIHVWGPVMVLPYSGPEDTLRALELIGSDSQVRGVSVIVLDLAGAIVDEAFGALALEQIAHTAETWGTELIFAEPSSLAEKIIAELEQPPLLVLKDLEHAIATAFQIARSQRRLV